VTFRSLLASAQARRAALALILAGAVVFPGVAGQGGARSCRAGQAGHCPARESVLWSRPLAGSWIVESGIEGTVPAAGQASAAMGHGVAVVGTGLTVSAFDALTGRPRWTATLAGVAAGSAIVSVRAWPGVISVGVAPSQPAEVAVPARLSGRSAGRLSGRSAAADSAGASEVIVLSSLSGKQIRIYPSSLSGGAVSASPRRTVVVGLTSVTSYDNGTGKAVWRVPTGAAEQAWRVAGRYLYVTVSAQGEVGTAPVTAVREINLRTGDERLIQPPSGAFDGNLAGVTDGVLVFSGTDGLSMYQVRSGRLTGQRPGAILEGFDSVQQVMYVEVNDGLVGIDPVTGLNEPGTKVPGPPGTYGVLGGVALGLDPGAGGDAWGYSIEDRRVAWTVRPLPWPHYFVDLSGLGGSSDQTSGLVLLATCRQTGPALPASPLAGSSASACRKPRLVAIGPWGATSSRT